MLILVINSGSSSVKYRVYQMEEERCLAWGLVDRIGSAGAVLTHNRWDGHQVKLGGEIVDHQAAIEYVLAILQSKNHGVIPDRSMIEAVGHRVVHGGERFNESVIIDEKVLEGIKECIELAPLHNPANLKGILACQLMLPTVPQVAVFDTAFHLQMPDYAYMYALPYVIYKRYQVRRYGFHGTSHRYVAQRASVMLGEPLSKLRLITCHLGNGCSMAAIKGGVSIDTTMGFTPVEGLVMGTRCGDIDPAALLHIMSREELGVGEANSLINKHSGLLGLSGISNDMREIERESAQGNSRARLALDVFCYRVKKYIGAYTAALGGLEGIVFTGGIGENSALVREKCLQGLDCLGIMLDPDKNRAGGSGERFINTEGGKAVMVIPTNEEWMIARDAYELVSKWKALTH